jgi:hypothetical protein
MRRSVASISRRLLFVGALVFILALASLWHYPSVSDGDSLSYGPTWGEILLSTVFKKKSAHILSTPHKRHRVVVASTFGFHYDVYMALAWTFKRVMQGSHGSIEVYAPTPFAFGFQRIVEELGLYDGTVRNPSDLIHDLTSNTGDGGIDMVILGTCEIEWVYFLS